jgi:hypothetical protein
MTLLFVEVPLVRRVNEPAYWSVPSGDDVELAGSTPSPSVVVVAAAETEVIGRSEKVVRKARTRMRCLKENEMFEEDESRSVPTERLMFKARKSAHHTEMVCPHIKSNRELLFIARVYV